MAKVNNESDELLINGTPIKRGERVTVDLTVAKLYTHTPLDVPVHVVRGHKPGPRVFISAAIHGDEINGVEIIRQILNKKILDRIKGTLIAV
ncbi:succinylglutamate desuccinylase/aspartoacylase family protein, partial [Kaarinaea lacus]